MSKAKDSDVDYEEKEIDISSFNSCVHGEENQKENDRNTLKNKGQTNHIK